jgi:2'-5' RNA ligase
MATQNRASGTPRNKPLRLFIAIEIPADVKSHIASVINELKASNADIRWEQIEKLHITLKFLGDTNEKLLPQIVLLLEGVASHVSPFLISYLGVGCFPNKREPRIIWVGAQEASGTLQSLVESIESAMASVGFEKEERKFHAHATVGRVKSLGNLHNLLRTMDSTTLDCQPTEVRHIVLIKSELKPNGSVYLTLKEFPLFTSKI